MIRRLALARASCTWRDQLAKAVEPSTLVKAVKPALLERCTNPSASIYPRGDPGRLSRVTARSAKGHERRFRDARDRSGLPSTPESAMTQHTHVEGYIRTRSRHCAFEFIAITDIARTLRSATMPVVAA